MARASKINPSVMLLETALEPKTKLTAVRCAREPEEVVKRRKNALGAIKQISSKCAHLRSRWSNALPEGSPARNLNLPLFYCITTTMGYSDKTLVKELMRGMPITGDIEKTNVLTERVRLAQTATEEWLKNLPARNRVVLGRAIRSQGSIMANECWAKTLAEVEAGWASKPVPDGPGPNVNAANAPVCH